MKIPLKMNRVNRNINNMNNSIPTHNNSNMNTMIITNNNNNMMSNNYINASNIDHNNNKSKSKTKTKKTTPGLSRCQISSSNINKQKTLPSIL